MPELKFLNLVKPVMFLIPEIKAPIRAVRKPYLILIGQ